MADDYTPTTEQVRAAACWARRSQPTLAEFDRWLAAHDAQVARAAAEKAWGEGYIAASADANDGGCVDFIEDADNPYRADRLAGGESRG